MLYFVLTCSLLYRYACSLLREGMRKIVINSESNGAKALEKVSDKSAIHKVSYKCFFQVVVRHTFVACMCSFYLSGFKGRYVLSDTY